MEQPEPSPVRVAVGRAVVSAAIFAVLVCASGVVFVAANGKPFTSMIALRLSLGTALAFVAGVTMTLPVLAAEHVATRWRRPTVANDVVLGTATLLAAGLGLALGVVQGVYGAHVIRHRSFEAGLAGVRAIANLPPQKLAELVLDGVAIAVPFVPLVLVRRRGGGLAFQSGAVVAATGAAAAFGIATGFASGPDAIVLGILVLGSALLPVVWEVPARLERRLLRRHLPPA